MRWVVLAVSFGVSGLRFASYGEPAFDAIMALTAAGGLQAGIRRISVPIPGADDAEVVGYAVMRRDQEVTVSPQLVLDMTNLAEIEMDTDAQVPLSARRRLRLPVRRQL